MSDHPDTFLKHAHKKGCDGQLVRHRGTLCVDRLGRPGNGGIVVHDYRCNRRWEGCKGQVFVTEKAVRRLAIEASR